MPCFCFPPHEQQQSPLKNGKRWGEGMKADPWIQGWNPGPTWNEGSGGWARSVSVLFTITTPAPTVWAPSWYARNRLINQQDPLPISSKISVTRKTGCSNIVRRARKLVAGVRAMWKIFLQGFGEGGRWHRAGINSRTDDVGGNSKSRGKGAGRGWTRRPQTQKRGKNYSYTLIVSALGQMKSLRLINTVSS